VTRRQGERKLEKNAKNSVFLGIYRINALLSLLSKNYRKTPEKPVSRAIQSSNSPINIEKTYIRSLKMSKFLGAGCIEYTDCQIMGLDFEIIIEEFDSAALLDEWLAEEPKNRVAIFPTVAEKYATWTDEFGVSEWYAKSHRREDWENLVRDAGRGKSKKKR
jgi:hypothetical protein